MFRQYLFLSSFLLILAQALYIPSFEPRDISYSTTPIPPSQDPWYTAPPGFEVASPGTILRIRIAPGDVPSVTPNCSQVYHILYRTTDSRYRPSWAVTSLYVPVASSNSSAGNALLSYQIPYNSADVNSSPSYVSRTGPISGDIPNALGRGWYISVPDFEGPLAAFGAGIQEGHAVLDSIRAVLSSGFGLQPEAKYAMWGYSGGSIASTWAAELQQQYAPELDFSGMAIGGIVPNISTASTLINKAPYAGLIPAILLGITAQYPDARAYLISRLKTNGTHNATGFLESLKIDIATGFMLYQNQDIYDYFVGGEADIKVPRIQDIINNNAYQGYHGIPRMPVFVYKAIQDEVAPVNEADALVDRYCSVGTEIL